MLIKVADFYIDAKVRCRTTFAAFAEYAVTEPHETDFSVDFSNADLLKEKLDFVKMYGITRCTSGFLERQVLLRKISDEIISRGAFLMHGAVIEYGGKGYMFTAPSGTGKTTHILLWQEYFGKENVRIINGDKPFIRIVDGTPYAYGTPWCGKEKLGSANARIELSAICFLTRAKENKLIKIDEAAAMPKILGQVDVLESANLAAQLDFIGVLMQKVPMYELLCNTEADAARVAYEGMNR